jgi:hypothetical protein
LISWIYAPLVPVSYLVTKAVFIREETDREQRVVNEEILKQLFSAPVLFGEALVVMAVRT